ncbi:MAG: T9SS type A sorting domain-containing protein [Bacteroidetes bacterium]|nr:T9SS type A sorting domain-containing protein [Bacteroidota bacterium]
MKNLLLLLLMLFAGIAHAQVYPDIHSQRPRIYVDSSRFAYLQANSAIGECGTTYTTFVNAVNNNWYNDPQLYLLGTDSTLWTWDFSSNWSHLQAIYVASLYRINHDPLALKRCRFVISKINTRWDTLNFANYDWYGNEDNIRELSDIGGIFLDWCHDDLPIPMRQNLARNLYKAERYFMNTYITSNAGNSYVSSHNAWNTIFANQFALVLDSADGLSNAEVDTVEQWYRITLDKFTNGFFPCYGHYRDDDGGWNWTAAYSMWSLIDQFQFFENMRIATGADYFHDLPWVLNSINQYWYFIQPDGWTINWGDGFTNIQADRVIYQHAREFNDPRSLWLAQYWSQPGNLGWTNPVYNKLMYKDFGMPVVTKPDIAHDWWSDKTGLSVSRTSWDADAALVWTYDAPNKKSSHDHRDNNTFCVYKNAPQIVNSGYYASYGNAHYINYYQRTIAHNSILVYDSTDQYTNWGVNVSNDGGQIESPTLMNYNNIFEPQYHRGNWVLWGSGNDYCYTISDAEQSYDSTKLDRFRRRVLFYKPDHVLVLDHVHLRNVGNAQRDAKWLLHFQKQPTINGNLLNAAVPGHIETFDGRDIVQANGNGNVAIRTLLPAASRTTRIGGTGYEFWVDGTNYPVGVNMDTVHTTPGRWRIEVAPTTVTDSLVFFHTIKIGDNNQPAVAGGFGQQNAFTIGTDWDNTLFFFNAVGDTGVSYHVLHTIPGGRSVGIFAADLEPNAMFQILVDQAVISTANTDTNGVLETSIPLAPGTHTVEINYIGVNVAQGHHLSDAISLFPNPAAAQVQVVLHPDFGSNARLECFDLQGRMLFSRPIDGQLTLDVSGLKPGIYMMVAKSEGRSTAKRLVIGR